MKLLSVSITERNKNSLPEGAHETVLDRSVVTPTGHKKEGAAEFAKGASDRAKFRQCFS